MGEIRHRSYCPANSNISSVLLELPRRPLQNSSAAASFAGSCGEHCRAPRAHVPTPMAATLSGGCRQRKWRCPVVSTQVENAHFSIVRAHVVRTEWTESQIMHNAQEFSSRNGYDWITRKVVRVNVACGSAARCCISSVSGALPLLLLLLLLNLLPPSEQRRARTHMQSYRPAGMQDAWV